MVKVGAICKTCKYCGGEWVRGCNYLDIEGHSRMFTDGKRIPTGYCDKYVEGQRVEYDPTAWKNQGRRMRV